LIVSEARRRIGNKWQNVDCVVVKNGVELARLSKTECEAGRVDLCCLEVSRRRWRCLVPPVKEGSGPVGLQTAS